MSSTKSAQLGQVRIARLSQVSLAGFDYVSPPTSNGHNFFVRTPFRVFLDSMEIPLSKDSIHVPMGGSGCWGWLARAGWPGRVR